jgi:mRNA-degrading endonuclease toxin of MazEF toxin-antitoxin module
MMPRPQVKQIWKVALSDAQANEQQGHRPAIVVSIHPETSMAMIVPFTKNPTCIRFPYTRQVKRSNANGLILDSVALIFQMRSLAISETRFIELMGTIEDNHLDQIKILIKNYLTIV